MLATFSKLESHILFPQFWVKQICVAVNIIYRSGQYIYFDMLQWHYYN